MNRKLPKIYHNDETKLSTNKEAYYSYRDNNDAEVNNGYAEESRSIDNNFFNYFDKIVNIKLIDGTSMKTKILSKLNNRILLVDGTYLDVDKIKEIL